MKAQVGLALAKRAFLWALGLEKFNKCLEPKV